MIINPYIFGGFDPDAQAFITAANITDNTQKTAINQLVVDLKAYNIWSKMKAIYPFVGGTASTHKWNLKDPRDLDAAFRLVFNGGWTHSSTGALPNGTNAFANTYFNPNLNLTNFNIHLSHYSRSQIINNAGCDIGGCNASFTNHYGLYQYLSSVSRKIFVAARYPSLSVAIANTNTLGFQIGSRTANNLAKLYFNNNILGSNTSSVITDILSNINLYIGSLNNNGVAAEFSNKQTAFATIGDGLTDTDATNLYNTVQNFQVALSRQV